MTRLVTTLAFLRSSSVMTSERCFIRALFLILAICAICSIVPDRFGVKPFCMLCSIKLLAVRKEYIALRRHDVIL
jgi:hypothetical protein